MLPGVLLVGPYFKVLTKIGLYDTRTGLIIAFLTICLPFSTWMMKGFIDKVPVELDQSAMIDGCSRMGVFFKIVAPVIAPGMVATILFAFLLAWGDLLWALCLTTSESMITVNPGHCPNRRRVPHHLAYAHGRFSGRRDAGDYSLHLFAAAPGSGLDSRSD